MRSVDVGIPAQDVIASQAGAELLESDLRLREIVGAYCEASMKGAESVLRGREGIVFVAEGGNSEVWSAANGITLKVSTWTTGRNRWRNGPLRPQDAIGQTLFMDWLQQDLAAHAGDDGVVAPEQYFALQTPSGNFMQSEQLMTGWESVARHCRCGAMPEEEASGFQRVIRERVAHAISRLALRSQLGMTDLCSMDGQSLNTSNILVPEGTTDPWDAQLCILDQPQGGLRGAAAIMMVRILSNRVPVTERERIPAFAEALTPAPDSAS